MDYSAMTNQHLIYVWSDNEYRELGWSKEIADGASDEMKRRGYNPYRSDHESHERFISKRGIVIGDTKPLCPHCSAENRYLDFIPGEAGDGDRYLTRCIICGTSYDVEVVFTDEYLETHKHDSYENVKNTQHIRYKTVVRPDVDDPDIPF